MVRVLTYPSNVREVCKDTITYPSLNQNLARWKFWWVCHSEDHFGVLRETSAQFKTKISKLKFWATILYKDQWRVCFFRDGVSALAVWCFELESDGIHFLIYADFTSRVSCSSCWRSLCRDHQIFGCEHYPVT